VNNKLREVKVPYDSFSGPSWTLGENKAKKKRSKIGFVCYPPPPPQTMFPISSYVVLFSFHTNEWFAYASGDCYLPDE
jgi:hypothetical protein